MIKITLNELIGSRPTLEKLSNISMNARTKYWLSKLSTKVVSETRNFEEARLDLCKKLGKPVKYVPKKDISGNADDEGMDLVDVTDPAELNSPTVMYTVLPENVEAFNQNMKSLVESELELTGVNKLKLADLTTAQGEAVDIDFDLSPILWLIEEPDDA